LKIIFSKHKEGVFGQELDKKLGDFEKSLIYKAVMKTHMTNETLHPFRIGGG